MGAVEKGHYHCVECESIFEASIKDARKQQCPVCGNSPTGKNLANRELHKEVVKLRVRKREDSSPSKNITD